MEGLELHLFGPIDARSGKKSLSGLREHRKAAELLVLLVLFRGRPLNSEWVATQLWPNTGSLDSLRHALVDLRRALGSEEKRLEAKSGSLLFDFTNTSVDVIAFDTAWEQREQSPAALVEAAELYRADLLADWYIHDDDQKEGAWVREARQQYSAQYRELLLLLSQAALTGGNFPYARRYLRRLTAMNEPAEALHVQLVESMIQARHYAEARALYDEYRDFLAQKYGLAPPDAMTERIHTLPRITTDFVPEFAPSLTEIEPAGGAVSPGSRFYIVRPSDELFHAAIARRDSIVRVNGPRQVGKTSLLARGLEQARQQGWRVVVTDFQKLSDAETRTLDHFFLTVAQQLADRLDLEVFPHDSWTERLTPSANFERFIRREILGKSAIPLVWGIDEADRLFDRDYRGSVFGLFRTWHNERALDPGRPWHRLTLILTYSTEANLFIPNLHQSPFNVGTDIVLHDFIAQQVEELNARYGHPLQNKESLERMKTLVGGHPYLVRRCLHEITTRGLDIAAIEAEAEHEDGPFGDHLERIRLALQKDANLLTVVRGMLRGETVLDRDSLSRLRAAGIVLGATPEQAHFRCGLYARYLQRRLL